MYTYTYKQMQFQNISVWKANVILDVLKYWNESEQTFIIATYSWMFLDFDTLTISEVRFSFLCPSHIFLSAYVIDNYACNIIFTWECCFNVFYMCNKHLSGDWSGRSHIFYHCSWRFFVFYILNWYNKTR